LTPEAEKAQEILKTRKGDFCPIMIGVGHPKKGAFQKGRTRLPTKNLVFYERQGGTK